MILIKRVISSLCEPLFQRKSGHAAVNTKYILSMCSTNQFHSSSLKQNLMEFFDKSDNWGASEVKSGRAWKKEELRIKSNLDLHKLWYVLLKERNMLMTMEHEAKEQVKLFPNPERIDKVNLSMENLETVVRERNRAYFELETGESGERPAMITRSPLGFRYFYRMREHTLPKFMNTRWHVHHSGIFQGSAVRKFLKLHREKLSVAKRKEINRNHNHVLQLIKRFPHLEASLLEEKYPDVNIQKARLYKKSRGHHEYNTA
ncbi:large ribosomal subunit protein uL29m [Anabrus simplex]|uniref:large ribosomal subunit protein uL29m n=1 Tax=Anabrus simplex TaxID=316456 RepID=UPI0034DD0773